MARLSLFAIAVPVATIATTGRAKTWGPAPAPAPIPTLILARLPAPIPLGCEPR